LDNFTWTINASIVIFAAKQPPQILLVTTTAVTPMSISNPRARKKKLCAKRRWRDVPWKPSAAMAMDSNPVGNGGRLFCDSIWTVRVFDRTVLICYGALLA